MSGERLPACSQRGPVPGTILGEMCVCGHVNVVHDANGCVMCALRVIALGNPDPQPPTLREQVADMLDRKTRVTHPDVVADAVLAVVADWLAAQPFSEYAAAYSSKAQRDHDVRLLRGGGA